MQTKADQERQHQDNRRDAFRKSFGNLTDEQLAARQTEYETEVAVCNTKLDALALHTEVLRAQLNAIAELAEVEIAKRQGANRLAELAEAQLFDRQTAK